MEENKKNICVWNIALYALFIVLVALGVSVVGVENLTLFFSSINSWAFILITLAVFRLTRLFIYDAAAESLRDMFLDTEFADGEIVRKKFDHGFKRPISDVLTCPWCFSIWASMFLLFFLMIFQTIGILLVYILAISAVASFIQILANLVGWQAEAKKQEVSR